MSQVATIRRNSLFVFASQVIRLLTNAVAFIGIARLYGPEVFGQFTAAHTLATIFILLADFGFDALLAAGIAAHRDRVRELGQTYLSMKLLFAFVACLAMMGTAAVQNISPDTRGLMYLFSGYVVVSALSNFFFALFKSVEQMHHEARISLLMNLVLFLAVVALGMTRASVYLLALAFILSRVVGLLLSLPVANRLISLTAFRFRIARREELLGISVFGFQSVCGILLFTQDTILLSWWAGDREVGIYQSVFKLVALGLLFSDTAFFSMLPVLSRLHASDPPQWVRVGHLLHKTLCYVSLPIAFVMIVCADQVMALLYGTGGYIEAVPLLRLFGAVIIVRYAAEASGIMLTSSNRQHIRLGIVVAAVLLNFGLNAVAIPRFGAAGAAVVSLITNLFVAAGYVVGAREQVLSWLATIRNYLPAVLALTLGLVVTQIKAIPLLPGAVVALLMLISVTYFAGYTPAERLLLFSLRHSTTHGSESIR
jgi:O-antigen/teichoic acid export membrane protein